MTEQQLIEHMAQAVAQSKHGNTMGVALDALREAIPGLDALIAGTGVVAPREPTEAMLFAGKARIDAKFLSSRATAYQCWCAMIEAAKGE